MIIIGINGPIGSGKSTAAAVIKKYFNRCRILPFAKGVKDVALYMGWDGKKDIAGRRLLQLLGTECGRECIDNNIWVNRWSLEVSKDDCDILVTDDIRFMNELEAVMELNGMTLQISGRTTADTPSNHCSEDGLDADYFDYYISNNGDLPAFHGHVLDFCKYVENKYATS